MIDVSTFDLSEYGLSLPQPEQLKYCEKLSSITLKQCPFKIPRQYWTNTKDDLKSLVKKTDRNELFYYLIYRECKLDGKPIESVKSLDSHVQFVDGYLRDYCATKISNGIVVVKGLVTHSMAYTKPPLNCWVALERQGGILCGHCDCKAGLGGSCSHVGVVLWGIVNLSEETCTSTLQRWHNKNPTNHPELPTTISSLKTAKRGAIVDKIYDAVTDETLNALLENLKKGPTMLDCIG